MPQYIEDELWGLHLAPHKTYSQEVEMPFRVSMAALNAKLESQERSSVFVRVDDIEYVLCSLTPSAIEQQLLNHTFVLGEKITFYTNGENAIHLTGNFLTLDEELDEGYPIDLNSASEDEEDEEEGEFDSEMDEEITSEEDQDEEDEEHSCGEFHSEDEDEPRIKELSPEEEKQLVADVNKKIKELKSKRAQSHDDEEDEDEEDDDISVDENLSFDDEEDDSEDDEEDSEFDSEFDEEDFDEDDSEEDSEMESEEEEEPVVVKNDKRVNPKTHAPEAKKPKMEMKETPKKEAPKQAAAATPQTKEASKAPQTKEVSKAPQAKDTPKQAAVVAPQSKETPKPIAAAQPKTETPAKKENQVADANKQPQQPQQPSKPVLKTLPSGLKMEDLKVGDGMKVKAGRKVAIAYKGSLTNGKVFDSSKPGNPLEFLVGKGDVVKGLEMGVQGMALNGTRRITIPAALAYGAKELPGIPKNSTLVFEVTIQSVSSK